MNQLRYLKPTFIIDSDNRKVIEFARQVVENINDPIKKAIKIFYVVRDQIWYDPYTPFYKPEHYKASEILKKKRGFCIPKASLLCALGRALGIPSRLAFFDVKNHLTTKQLREFFGSDIFVFHGVTEFFLNGKWVKATPAFNAELCKIHNVPPLEFNGKEDAIFQAFNLENKQFMEYLRFRGSYEDVPLNEILKAFEEEYGKDKVNEWIRLFETSGKISLRDFAKEQVWKGGNKYGMPKEQKS